MLMSDECVPAPATQRIHVRGSGWYLRAHLMYDRQRSERVAQRFVGLAQRGYDGRRQERYPGIGLMARLEKRAHFK